MIWLTFKVTIGATIEELTSAVEKAKSSLESLKGGVEGLVAAFSIKELGEFVDSMAKLGEQTERMSAILGVSTTTIQELGTIAKLVGGDANSMALAMERLQLGLQRAAVPTSQQAMALRALGISAQSLIGLKLDDQMNRIADVFSKFADGTNKTAIAMALFGRAGAQMIPYLDQGRVGLERWRQEMLDFGTVATGPTIEALAGLDRRITIMNASFTALGQTLVGSVSKTLSDFADGLAKSAGSLNIFLSTGNFTTGMLAYMTSFVENLIAKLGALAVVIGDIVTLRWGEAFAADMARANAVIEATGRKTSEDLNKVFADTKKQYDDLAKHVEVSAKPTAPAMDFGASQRAKAALEAANQEIKDNQLIFDDTKTKLEEGVKLYTLTEGQKTAALIDAINKREDADLAALNVAEIGMQQGSIEWTKVQNEKLSIMLKADAEIEKSNKEMFSNMSKAAVQFGDTIASSVNSQLRSLLAGTETLGQAVEKAFGDLIIKMIEKVIEFIAVYATLEAVSLATGLPAPAIGAVAQSVGLVPKLQAGTNYVPSTGLCNAPRGRSGNSR